MEQIPQNEKMPAEVLFENGDMKVTYIELPFGSKAIEIDQPDEAMFTVVNRIMHDDFTGSVAYNAKKDCGVFWQVGHEPDTDYIQLEFWKPDPGTHRAFGALILRKYKEEKLNNEQ